MAVAGLAVAVEQHVVGGVEEQEMRARARAIERIELLFGVREEQAAARIDHERDFLLAAFSGHVDRRRHQCRRKVVEGVVAEVLEDLYRLRFARAGESCDDDEVWLTRRGQSGRIHDRTTPTIATALISARQMIRTAETLDQYWASIPRRRMACSARAKTQRPSGYDTRVSPISTNAGNPLVAHSTKISTRSSSSAMSTILPGKSTLRSSSSRSMPNFPRCPRTRPLDARFSFPILAIASGIATFTFCAPSSVTRIRRMRPRVPGEPGGLGGVGAVGGVGANGARGGRGAPSSMSPSARNSRYACSTSIFPSARS